MRTRRHTSINSENSNYWDTFCSIISASCLYQPCCVVVLLFAGLCPAAFVRRIDDVNSLQIGRRCLKLYCTVKWTDLNKLNVITNSIFPVSTKHWHNWFNCDRPSLLHLCVEVAIFCVLSISIPQLKHSQLYTIHCIIEYSL